MDDENLSENVRLTNRVMDLRRPQMQRNLMLRYKTSIQVRNFLDKLGFVDIETPMLGKSTPKALATIWCLRACMTASSLRCHSRPSCTSRC